MDPLTESMAKPVEMHERRRQRTGTWTFMSIGSLQNPKKAHEILDDFESAFWTMVCSGIHHIRHTGKFDVSIFTEAHYDPNVGPLDAMVVGGDRKYMVLCKFPIKFSCRPFNRLVRYLSSAIRQYYESRYRLQELEDARAADSDSDSEDDPEPPALTKARQAFKEHHKALSDPQFWLEAFREALSKDGWCDDFVEEDHYTPQTEEEQTQQIESLIRNSFQTSKQPEYPLVGSANEGVDRINFIKDPIAIELERSITLISASYDRRGLDLDNCQPPQTITSPSSSPLHQQLTNSGVTEVELSSGPPSAKSITDRKRKHTNTQSKTSGTSETRVDPESGHLKKRRVDLDDYLPPIQGHVPSVGEANVGSDELSHL